MHALHEWIFRVAPAWARVALGWLTSPPVLVALGVFSMFSFVLTAAGVPWFLARLPEDYFSTFEQRRLGVPRSRHAGWHLAARAGRNVFGLVLLLTGVVTLVLPGQGLLTLLVAFFLLDFPGKRRLQRRLLIAGPLARAVDALRRRAGQPPLRRPVDPPPAPPPV